MSMAPPPYMMSVKNIVPILTKIKSAGTPPKFTIEFLKSNLGFSSSSDRGIIPQLKYIGFLTDDGTPTERYNQYRGSNSKAVLAEGVKEGYSEVFLADQKAYEKTFDQLKDMFTSLTGKGDSVTQKMASTFKSLCGIADFKNKVSQENEEDVLPKQEEKSEEVSSNMMTTPKAISSPLKLRHDIHVHLPPTSDVSVYKAIFRAINDELAD